MQQHSIEAEFLMIKAIAQAIVFKHQVSWLSDRNKQGVYHVRQV